MSLFRVFACACVVFSVFLLNFNFVINHLFDGGHLFDSGYFVGLVYHNWALDQPISIGDSNYYKTHFTPWLSVMSAVSYLVPLPAAHYYAVTQGLIYALLSYAGWRTLEVWFPSSSQNAKLFSLSLVFAYNGITQFCIDYPHFEALYAAGAILFLVNLAENRVKSAALWFFFTLGVREDAGLHLFGILFLLGLASSICPSKLRVRHRVVWLFALVALLVPCFILLSQKFLIPGDDDALRRVYFGDPVYSHLTREYLSEHIPKLLLHAAYLWPSWVLLLAGSYVKRSIGLAVGFFSVLPWLLLNALALAPAASLLTLYYGFPAIVVLLWPTLWWRFQPDPPNRAWMLRLQVAILLLSCLFFTWRHPRVLRSSLSFPRDTLALNAQLESLVNENLSKENVYFDTSIAAIFPHLIPRNRLIQNARERATLIGFRRSSDWELAREMSLKSPHYQRLASGQPVYRLGKTPSSSPVWSAPTRFPLN